MEYNLLDNKNPVELQIKGRLDYSDHASFREIIARIPNYKGKQLVFDLSAVEFIDSAGLGMLLLANDKSREASVEMVLRKPQGQVEKILKAQRFDSVLTIVS